MTTGDTWTNWSGNVVCAPRQTLAPPDEAGVVAAVRAAAADQTGVRAVGTGHSFVPLCATGDTLLTCDRLQGLVQTDPARQQATIRAGTKLHALGAPLHEAGLALANMGDIDRQSLAGAISTGTHGTGPTLGSIATAVVGLRLVLASGETLDCSATQHPEIFRIARVALGTLGIITRITMQLLPAYRLHERTWVAPFEGCLAELAARIAAHRHFEFFWDPVEDACAMKSLDPATATQRVAGDPAAPAPGQLSRYLNPERIDWSYRIFPSARDRRFNEMEFAVPAEHGPDCLRELRDLMRRKHPAVTWPIEYRTQRADDIPLSPAFGRETVTISLHQDSSLPYRAFFADAEAIFRNHRGRPHWGKIHGHTARELADIYPQWAQFQEVRQALDPAGIFLNPYLRELLLA